MLVFVRLGDKPLLRNIANTWAMISCSSPGCQISNCRDRYIVDIPEYRRPRRWNASTRVGSLSKNTRLANPELVEALRQGPRYVVSLVKQLRRYQ